MCYMSRYLFCLKKKELMHTDKEIKYSGSRSDRDKIIL